MNEDARTLRSPAQAGGALRRHAYDLLKQMIVTSEFHPGERLSEVRLANMLGVSRTPLREALMLLEMDGLVVGQPNSGYAVVHFDPAAIRELLVAREGLDAFAAELACRDATDEDLAAVAAVLEEIDALGRRRTRSSADTALELELGLKVHETIVAATRNRPLQDMTRRLYEQLRVALWLEVLLTDSWADSVREHRAIVEAVLARDVPRAVAAARDHVRVQQENMARVEDAYAERRRGASAIVGPRVRPGDT
jgi:DNA-binding GntR family transcriptional regulator